MSPEDAFHRVLARGPFDDPTMSWYPVRWYLSEDGTLCSLAWRGAAPTVYPEHRWHGTVTFGGPRRARAGAAPGGGGDPGSAEGMRHMRRGSLPLARCERVVRSTDQEGGRCDG